MYRCSNCSTSSRKKEGVPIYYNELKDNNFTMNVYSDDKSDIKL